jgi:hypothetical protein
MEGFNKEKSEAVKETFKHIFLSLLVTMYLLLNAFLSK